MVVSKYTASERLSRKRLAARLRQQRCRARKRAATSVVKQDVEHGAHAQSASASSSTIPSMSHADNMRNRSNLMHHHPHPHQQHLPYPPPYAMNVTVNKGGHPNQKIVMLAPPSHPPQHIHRHMAGPAGPPPSHAAASAPVRYVPSHSPQSMARPTTAYVTRAPPGTYSYPPSGAPMSRPPAPFGGPGPQAPGQTHRRISSASSYGAPSDIPSVVQYKTTASGPAPPPAAHYIHRRIHSMDSYDQKPTYKGPSQTIVVPAGARVIVHPPTASQAASSRHPAHFAPIHRGPAYSIPLPHPHHAHRYPTVVSRTSSRDDSTLSSTTPECSPDRLSPKRPLGATKDQESTGTPAAKKIKKETDDANDLAQSSKTALWSKEKAAIAAMLTLGKSDSLGASTDEADTPNEKQTAKVTTRPPQVVYAPASSLPRAFEPPRPSVLA